MGSGSGAYQIPLLAQAPCETPQVAVTAVTNVLFYINPAVTVPLGYRRHRRPGSGHGCLQFVDVAALILYLYPRGTRARS
jgi:hypothetical protein